jgi:hypothetical protein
MDEVQKMIDSGTGEHFAGSTSDYLAHSRTIATQK